jgi:hypothetical protein
VKVPRAAAIYVTCRVPSSLRISDKIDLLKGHLAPSSETTTRSA